MKPAPVQSLLRALTETREPADQRTLIEENPRSLSLDLIEELSTYIRQCLPKDPRRGEALTDACFLIAERVDDPVGWAHANRARACAFTNRKECAQAERFYEIASALFAAAGAWCELGRTEIIHAENLTNLSEYSRAQALASHAYGLLKAHGESADLARVHIFAGNLFNRLHRYGDALGEYERAGRVLGDSTDYMTVAAVELNRASVLVELNEFDEALASLERARDHCDRHSISLWSDILDRNIARLYFSLGRYSDALRSLNEPRPRYRELGDARRLALCDQACALIYLQLNMFREAQDLAERAHRTFEQYSNPLEAAECIGIVGIARAERGDVGARDDFLEAIRVFEQEGNRTALAGMRLQLGRFERSLGNHASAGELARLAVEGFEHEGLAVRAAYARLVQAQTHHALDQDVRAMQEARKAFEGLSGYHATWVSYQCRDLLATLHAGQGDVREAERLYAEAIADIESLRGNLELDEFRTSFGKDKFRVYENLAALKIGNGQIAEAFRIVERSKSRTLIDLLEHSTESVWKVSAQGEKRRAVDRLRHELNGLYSRLSTSGTTVGRAGSDVSLRRSIQNKEREMMETLRGAASERQGWVALEATPPSDLRQVREMLGPDEALVEYYTIGDRFCAFVVDKDGPEFFAELAPVCDVSRSLRGFEFQISKFHLNEDYLADRRDLLLSAVRYHLTNLYEMLVAPLESRLSCTSLAIVPHGPAHYIPFQALCDGDSYLIDRFNLVHGASATILKLCRDKPEHQGNRDLVLAVPDESAPAITEEAQVLADLLPNADVFVGAEAKAELLARHGASVGKLHIAAHGVFRSDNPMFSALRLGDSWLNLVDVFNLSLGCELTTLSACETGMNSLYGGDELLGLTQGFLYAGTPSLVVSLWRVNDRSTTILMKRFYEELLHGTSRAEALRRAALAVREEYPHPYYWAPFVLLGKS